MINTPTIAHSTPHTTPGLATGIRRGLATWLVGLVLGVQVHAASAQAPALARLFEDYYQLNARFAPLEATFSGDNRFDDQLGMSIAPTQRANHDAKLRALAARLQAVDAQALGAVDRTSVAIMDYELREAAALQAFPDHLLPIDHMSSVPVTLANLASGDGSQPLKTPRQLRAYLNRVHQLSDWIDQAVANMRAGLHRGVVQPRAIVLAALPQYRQLVSDTAASSVFYTPTKNLPNSISALEQQRLRGAYATEIDQRLNPALRRLVGFLQDEYLPGARASAGWSALPQGLDWYQALARHSTTTNLTPQDIHAIGLREVARIQQQFAALGPRLGYQGAPERLPQWVATQARFRPFTSEEQIYARYRALDAQLQNLLPRLFTLMPKAALEVRAEPELTRATASDHYTMPSADGKRPGIFWAVVQEARQYQVTGMTTLFLHEGRPGHHFQLALQQELKLPAFRRFGGNNAFIEGWALYAETLGREMGLYDQPDQLFGHLSDEMLRATRLVIDTGLHAKGWSREQAIAYMRETLGYSEAESTQAVERYMVWPGQALGYKIGALKIMELRQQAQQALGKDFQLSEFHAVVLEDGTLPLDLLQAKVQRWIAQRRRS